MPTKIDFIGGNTKRCLMAMALPMIAAMFLNMMYNLVDSLWIGNLLGETAYAALTNSTPIILILTSVAMGATNGVSILISQAIGAKDKKKAESLIATSFCVAVTFSLLVTILLEIFLPGILKALNTPAETYDMAYSYLAIYILGYLAVYLYLYFTAVLRSFGNSMFQAVAMLVSTILNAVFDPVFIHFIGFHGAAIATLLSQMICLLFMLTYLKKKKLFTFKISAFNCSDVLLLIQKAIPSVIQQSIPAISTTSLAEQIDKQQIRQIGDYQFFHFRLHRDSPLSLNFSLARSALRAAAFSLLAAMSLRIEGRSSRCNFLAVNSLNACSMLSASLALKITM